MAHFIITHKSHFFSSYYRLRETTEGVFLVDFKWLFHCLPQYYVGDVKEEQFVLNFYQHLCHVRHAQKLFLCPVERQIGLYYNFNLA